jgi:hypothetical protein
MPTLGFEPLLELQYEIASCLVGSDDRNAKAYIVKDELSRALT